MALRVNIEDLVTSGAAITSHGEEVAARHAAADGRIEAAQVGWQGLSSLAMSARAESWRTTTSGLLTRMSDHAQGLHGSVHGFAKMDSDSSRALEAVTPRPGHV